MVENIIQTILILLAIFVPVIRKNNEYGNLSLSRDYTIFLRAIAIVLVVCIMFPITFIVIILRR